MAYTPVNRIDLRNRVNLELFGAAGVEEQLMKLSLKWARSAGRRALYKAAKDILTAAKQEVPANEGRLRKALAIRSDNGRYRKDLILTMVYVSNSRSQFRPRKTQRKSRVKGVLGPPKYAYQIGSKPNVYGAFLEFGAPGHGIPANPWMRRAWERAGGAKALATISREIWITMGEAAWNQNFKVSK